MRHTTIGLSDEDAIRQHVVSLFDAYLAGDLETLRAGRIEDWKGFQIRSTRLVRGIDQYMKDLRDAMGGLSVDSYEFLDFEIDIEGDLGIVYYLARDFLSASDDVNSPKTILIRSIDIYRRVSGNWTQIGSNICAVPDSR
ncbi:MAG TPA: nuclear transport factor 2 family protein [Acidimicrobiia bacterium]|nr:nuclear transport factor 2 family protein [Acidimicrobiia bacterium]